MKSHITLLGCTAQKFVLLSFTAARSFKVEKTFFSSTRHNHQQLSKRNYRHSNIMPNPWTGLGALYTSRGGAIDPKEPR